MTKITLLGLVARKIPILCIDFAALRRIHPRACQKIRHACEYPGMYVYTTTSKKIWSVQILGVFAMILWLSGCEQQPAAAASAELVSIQAEVFDVVCVECHRAGFAAGELDLSDAATSAQSLTRVPATNRVAHENGWVRVEPGDPELSFLMRKLRSPGVGEGAAMPPGDHELTDAYVELIAEWIRQLGAQGASL